MVEQTEDFSGSEAEAKLSHLRETRSRISTQEAEIAKWMLASLLTLNAGAIIAVQSKNETLSHTLLFACGFFVVGIIAALSTSFFVQRANRAIIDNLNDWEEYWIKAFASGKHDHPRRRDLDRQGEGAFAGTRLAPKAAIVSAGFFCVGCIVAGASFW